jgi:adenylate cyclase
MNSDTEIASMVTWLVAGAPPPGSIENLIAALAERLTAAGLPIDSLILYKFNIHPMFPAGMNIWTKKRGVRSETVPHSLIMSEEFQSSPQASTISERRMERYQFNGDYDVDLHHMWINNFQNAGYIDLVYLPLFNVDGSVNRCVFFGTKFAQGFNSHQVKQMRRLQSPIARVCEHFGDQSDMEVSLATYLGKNIGRKVLDGKIRRGDGETISAVLLFVDLVGFTEISNTRPATEVLEVLNDFYEAINSSVENNYGEILKFIGDGALVIFPVVDDLNAQESAARNALNSVAHSRTELQNHNGETAIEFRASLHIGEIFYGNIGSQNRLDFTAIGPAVNLASRLLDKASALNAKTVCSQEFQAIANVATNAGTICELKGFQEPVSVYVVE